LVHETRIWRWIKKLWPQWNGGSTPRAELSNRRNATFTRQKKRRNLLLPPEGRVPGAVSNLPLPTSENATEEKVSAALIYIV